MELRIEHTWDGLPVSHDPVAIALQSYDAGLLMQVSAPFFNDPPAPLGAPGKPFRKLWDYEGKCNFCCKYLLLQVFVRSLMFMCNSYTWSLFKILWLFSKTCSNVTASS
uniref:Uncharacterized protein n=1 Tax=Meleagris gallopavo TaxID=9103 RepID=A0A803Y1W7_MELGA